MDYLPANKILPSVGRSFYSREKSDFARANDFLKKSTTEAQGLTPRLPIPKFAEIYSGTNPIQAPENGSNDFSPAVIPQIDAKQIQPVNTNSIQPDTWSGNNVKSAAIDEQAILNPKLGTVTPIDAGNTNPVLPTAETETWFASHKLAVILVILLIILLLVYFKN